MKFITIKIPLFIALLFQVQYIFAGHDVENGGLLTRKQVENEIEIIRKNLFNELETFAIAHSVLKRNLPKLKNTLTKKQNFEATNEILTVPFHDGERKTVDAKNNGVDYIRYNITAWNILNICNKFLLVLHENLSLISAEKSLTYTISNDAKSFLRACKQPEKYSLNILRLNQLGKCKMASTTGVLYDGWYELPAKTTLEICIEETINNRLHREACTTESDCIPVKKVKYKFKSSTISAAGTIKSSK